MNEQPEALRLADLLDEKWHRWKDDPTDELKAAAELRRLHAENEKLLAVAELCRLHAENEKLLAVLEEAEYALDYASDMTKPEGLSGCDCPICTASIRIGEVLAGKRRQA